MDPDGALGRRGEDLAHRELQRRGYVVVARNWVTRSGRREVDLVAWKDSALVFVEVKARRTHEWGGPELRVDELKVDHLTAAAREYCRRAGVAWEQARVDVVTVVMEPKVCIQVIEDALREWR
jgi:putative endonuclease